MLQESSGEANKLKSEITGATCRSTHKSIRRTPGSRELNRHISFADDSGRPLTCIHFVPCTDPCRVAEPVPCLSFDDDESEEEIDEECSEEDHSGDEDSEASASSDASSCASDDNSDDDSDSDSGQTEDSDEEVLV